MTSIVSICNLALSNLGKENIADVNEASTQALACKQFYEPTRDMLLQSYPWRFARQVVALAAVAVPDGLSWAYAYQRPPDCLKIRTVSGLASCDLPIVYDIAGSLILCGSNPAYLDFTARAEDTAHYPPLFADALAWHLTVRLAMPMTRDLKMRNDAWQLAQALTRQAEASDANEVRETSDITSEFMASRGAFDMSKTTHPGFRPTENRDPHLWDDSRFWID